ncbi:MAG: formylglycine-generating enzyme family protein, partial [Anaerolineaceae bacterium]|nr:formylglycine-generating enzyme family protein [Anaerolineaceae bacterium]
MLEMKKVHELFYFVLLSCFVIIVSSCVNSEADVQTSTASNIPDQEIQTVPNPQEALNEFWVRPTDDMPVLYVPGGTFQMGSSENDPDAGTDEFPQHTVTRDSFWIDQTEVTNAQYNLCVDFGVCRKSHYAGNAAYNEDDHPIVGIAWQDAVDYCTWAGGRLPTESEWEYAAKGEDGFIYPWGNVFDGNLVNSCDENCSESWADESIDDGYKENAPAGSFPGGASWVGALDMAGNVWEWTWDWCEAYSSDPQINPGGPDNGSCKIIRCGAWASPPAGIRTTYRIIGSAEIAPGIRHPNIGFRCIVPVSQENGERNEIVLDSIIVPPGNPPIIDGTMSFGEWDNATVESFTDGSELFLIHADGYLYLGIQAETADMIGGNIFINRGDEIVILHSSAALGTAIYQKAEDSWQQIQDFNWRCRETDRSDAAQTAHDAFLQQEGWLAANSRMGNPNELEYQIEMPEKNIRLAVIFL